MTLVRQSPRSVLAAWGALALSCGIWVLVLVLDREPFHLGPRALRYFDLRIYVAAAHRLVDGVPLYATPLYHGLGFTYPPLSAMLFAPFTGLSFSTVAAIVTVVNVGLLLFALRRALAIADRPGGRSAPPHVWAWVAAAAAVGIWLEPVSVTLGYGQVDLLIAALVVFDLSRPRHARTAGVGIGLAAAIKLTPVLFIVFLAVSGRRRAAAVAIAVCAAVIGLGFAVAPGDASAFWAHRVLHAAGVGNPPDPANQSLRGMIARLGASGSRLEVIWLAASVVVVIVALALARAQARRGDEAAAYSLVALATLLASPISWTHHWALAVPALALLARRAWTRGSRRLAIATGLLVALGWAYLPEFSLHRHQRLGAITLLTCDEYVLVGLVVIAACAAAAIRERGGARSLVPQVSR